LSFSRRQFLTLAGATTVGTVAASPLQMLYARVANGQSITTEGYGPLIPDPNGLLDLPRGFQYRVFSRFGDTMSDGTPVPDRHDGMAAFPGPNNTTILVRNHEHSPGDPVGVVAPDNLKYDSTNKGGTTTLVVGPDRQLIRDYASLAGTYRNCAGGTTPWGSWISCEENTSTPETNRPGNANNVAKRHGYNFEVPAQAEGLVTPEPLVAMGRFNHEAVAIDPRTGIVYETEDRNDGLFYRFIPNQPGNLKAGGILEALRIQGQPQAITRVGFPVGQKLPVDWVRIENPDPATDTVRVEGFTKGAAQFSRGEGAWFGNNNEVYFTCTNGGAAGFGQVWRYTPGGGPQEGGTLELFVESPSQEVLDFPDNIVVSPFRDLFLCEDGQGEQFVRGVTDQGQLYSFARNALNESEFAGACFSNSPLTMFLNIYRPGITFAIWGPWDRRRG
jgi:uncharacterized protein